MPLDENRLMRVMLGREPDGEQLGRDMIGAAAVGAPVASRADGPSLAAAPTRSARAAGIGQCSRRAASSRCAVSRMSLATSRVGRSSGSTPPFGSTTLRLGG